MPSSRWVISRTDVLALALLAAVSCSQIFIPPVVALANNGDFGKVLGTFSLGSPVRDEYAYAPTTFHFDSAFHYPAIYSSSEFALAGIAICLSSLIAKSGDVDIRCIGIVHLSLFLLAVYCAIPLLSRCFGPKTRLAVLLAVGLVFGDAMYASLFNSFYMDAAALVFFCLAITFSLRLIVWKARLDAVFTFLACTMFVGAKAQHAVLAVPLSLLLAHLCRSAGYAKAGVLGASILLATCAWTLYRVPSDYTSGSVYTVLFYGILPNSTAPTEDLQSFGLKSSYQSYIGTHAFDQSSGLRDPSFAKDFAQRCGHFALARFYVTHPATAYRLLRRATGEAGRQRPGLGNFDRTVGYPPYFESQAFANWSRLKAVIFSHRGSRYLWFTIIALASLMLSAILSSQRDMLLAAACFGLMTLVDLGISGLGDAVETARHFTFFNAMVDAALILTVISTLKKVQDLYHRNPVSNGLTSRLLRGSIRNR